MASLKARQIGEIRRARREAWRAWEESCKPAAKTTRRSGWKGSGGAIEANEIKGQSGNPAFLEKVYDGIRLEARITGTEAPQKQTLDGDLRIQSDHVALLDAWKRRNLEAAKSRPALLED